jgi:hypothetical protein
VRTLLLVVFALLGVLLVWKVLTGLSDEGPSTASGGDGSTSASGPSVAPRASPPPEGKVSSRFPHPARGTRLQLKVLALGDHPEACRAESIDLAGEVRTVYHHACTGEGRGEDTYYFLVRLSNLTDGTVPAELAGFTLGKPGKGHEVPLDPSTVAQATISFFPTARVLGPQADVKGWLTFNGSNGFTPSSLTYLDDPESLIVRFEGTWTRR